jgi:hypothetical protein
VAVENIHPVFMQGTKPKLQKMKKGSQTAKLILVLLLLAAVALYEYFEGGLPEDPPLTAFGQAGPAPEPSSAVKSGQWLLVKGTVRRILSDDNVGSRHQRFIIEVADHRTLLIAHNIDLAHRVPVESGDVVTVRGRYEANDRGGVIHWTHHDPDGFGPGGWVEHKGERYR